SSSESLDGLWFVCHESFSFRVKLIFGPASDAEDQVNETKGNDDLKGLGDWRQRQSNGNDDEFCWREPCSMATRTGTGRSDWQTSTSPDSWRDQAHLEPAPIDDFRFRASDVLVLRGDDWKERIGWHVQRANENGFSPRRSVRSADPWARLGPSKRPSDGRKEDPWKSVWSVCTTLCPTTPQSGGPMADRICEAVCWMKCNDCSRVSLLPFQI